MFYADAMTGQEQGVMTIRAVCLDIAGVLTDSGRLLPGMTANVRVVTEVRENVLKVPNAALRVRIAGVEPQAVQAPADGMAAPERSAAAGARTGATRQPAADASAAAGGVERRTRVARGRIHLLDEQGRPVALNVGTGVSDGMHTELLVRPGTPAAEALVEGAQVVTGVTAPTGPARPTGPRMPF